MYIKSFLYHLQINIDFKNLSFYQDLMKFLGWKVILEAEDVVGYKSEKGGDLWFVDADKYLSPF